MSMLRRQLTYLGLHAFRAVDELRRRYIIPSFQPSTKQNISCNHMWICPNCRHKFFNKNQSHSCGNYTIDDFLDGKSDKAVGLFEFFLSEYRKIGAFELHPVKTRVALLTKMRFCSINRIGADYIDVHFVLTEEHNDRSLFRRIDNLGDRFFIHHLRIRRKSDIDSEVRKYMMLAYAVGNRKHIADRT